MIFRIFNSFLFIDILFSLGIIKEKNRYEEKIHDCRTTSKNLETDPSRSFVFFFFTILKSLTLSLSNCIAFSIATILLLLIPHLLKKTKLKEKINQWSPQTIKVLFRFLLLVHLIFMVLFSLLFISEPRNDLGTIYHSALEIVENGKINTEIDENTSCYHFYGYSNNDYFNNCQNNIMLLLILTLLYKVMSLLGFALTLEGTLLISQFFNILCIELAIWIGLKILQKKKILLRVLSISFCLFSFYLILLMLFAFIPIQSSFLSPCFLFTYL